MEIGKRNECRQEKRYGINCRPTKPSLSNGNMDQRVGLWANPSRIRIAPPSSSSLSRKMTPPLRNRFKCEEAHERWRIRFEKHPWRLGFFNPTWWREDKVGWQISWHIDAKGLFTRIVERNLSVLVILHLISVVSCIVRCEDTRLVLQCNIPSPGGFIAFKTYAVTH